MIADIRAYFRSIIKEVDSDLKEHQEYFTSENIADTNLEDKFFIRMGQMLTERQDSNMIGELTVNIEIYKNGYNNTIENLDEAFCKALEIQLKAMDQARIDQLEIMKAVVGDTITPIANIDNSNLAIFNLEFIVTVGYRSY